MGIVHLAFDGVAWIGAFLIVHVFTSFLLKDRTNINFGASILIVFIPSYVLYYGIPAEGLMVSFRVFATISVAVLLAWLVAGFGTVLVWWEDLLIGIVAVSSYLLLYAAAQWLWVTLFLK